MRIQFDFHGLIEVYIAICYFRNLRSFVYSDNNPRIGHIKDEAPYVKYDVNNTEMNTLQKFGFTITVCIPKTLTTLSLKAILERKRLYGFSFTGGKHLQKLTFQLRLNVCVYISNIHAAECETFKTNALNML
jgi:hypothetical protein